ncbi:MAG: hypothetical protein AB1489_09055 [Acidobacteriota bacterium]
MKRERILMVVLAAMLLVAASLTGSKATTQQEDEPFPCDPAPSQVRICQLRGGTFDYVTCRCVFP